MEKIMIISTGGTIASLDRGGGALPDAGAARGAIAPALAYLRRRGVPCMTAELFGEAGIDSSEMSPRGWLALTREIERGQAAGIKKFLVVHGTDTMAYSAAWLSLTISGAAVVLTGSQRTQDEADFDGADNMLGAAMALCDTESGVWIYFAGQKFSGAHVHKEDCSGLSAYAASGSGAPRPLAAPTAADWEAAARGLAVFYAHPAACGAFPKGAKVLVLCGYGSGNIPRRLHEALEAAYPRGARPVVIAASSCAKGEKNPARYSGVGMAALADKNFILFGQGCYSLEFIITLSYLALLSEPESPERILSLYLEKF